jgi:transposase InsO family protein
VQAAIVVSIDPLPKGTVSPGAGSARSRLHRGRAEPQVGHRLHLHPDLDGFVYVAFVVDCFSRAIVGWHAFAETLVLEGIAAAMVVRC